MKSSPEDQDAFWNRIDALAAGAFMAIPCAGPTLSDFFTNTVVPTCSGMRNRLLGPLVHPFIRPRRATRSWPLNDTTS